MIHAVYAIQQAPPGSFYPEPQRARTSHDPAAHEAEVHLVSATSAAAELLLVYLLSAAHLQDLLLHPSHVFHRLHSSR